MSVNNWKEHIEKKYEKEGYLDKYGGSVILTSVILGLFGSIFGYHYFMTDIKVLKKDWANVRCNPLVMPFAGIINAPPEGSKWEYTAENFGYCLSEIVKGAVNVEKVGLSATQSVLQGTLQSVSNSIKDARSLFASIRGMAGGLFTEIFNKLLNVLLPLQKVLIKSMDSLKRVGGVATMGLFTALGGVLSINSFMFLFLIVVIFILISIAGFVVAMLLTGFTEMTIPFFGWVLAIPEFALGIAATTFMIAILAIFIPIIVVITDIVNLTSKVPAHRKRLIMVQKKTKEYARENSNKGEGFKNRKMHFCFDLGTLIHIKNKGNVRIENICIGDKLMDGGAVTSLIQTTDNNEEMYELYGIRVTGNHRIVHDVYGCIPVKDHPDSNFVKDYRGGKLYCINTTTKRIPIKNVIFFDYDDVDEMDLDNLRYIVSESDNSTKSFIHEALEPAVSGEMEVELDDGRSVKIKNLKINDQLKFGERVLGVIKIDGKNIKSIERYQIGKTTIIGTKNLKLLSKDLGVIPLCKLDSCTMEKSKYMYNIITNSGAFLVNDIKLLDYNSGIRSLLWKSKNPIECLRE